MDPILCLGSQGPSVKELQELLNKKSNATLKVDGNFGPKTDQAVRKFQRDCWLVVDGAAGPCTWAAVRGKEKWVILHEVRLVPQWTPDTCWSAATAMLKGVQACMSPGGVDAVGGLDNDSALDDPVNVRKFANFHGLTMLPGQSWTPGGIAGLLQRGPLMINTLWNVDDFVKRKGSPGHMRILAGIRGDGNSEGSTVRIYDPWPPNKGEILSKVYGVFMRETPAATYQIFYR